MTPEEMQEALDKALESITKLENKNKELIAREKQAKADADTAKTAADDAAEEAARKAGDLETLEKTLSAKHQKMLDALIKERDAASAQLNTLLIDNTIQRTLVESNVAPHMHEPLTALFKTQAKLVDGRAMHGDVELTDHLKSYFAGDAGKHFVTAPNNSGGGAVGVKSAQAGHGFTKETLTLTEFSKLAKDQGPEAANAIAKSVGSTFQA